MYFILGFLILLGISLSLLTYWRIRGIRKKVCSLTHREKSNILNELIAPFGFSYDSCKDLFTSRPDAWQRDFGYSALYDLQAQTL